MRLGLHDILNAVDGRMDPGHPRANPLFFGVGTDSRLVKPGDLFACIPGERVDGHDFAAQALAAGAVAVLAQRALPGIESQKIILVPDTVAALGRLASFWRERCGAVVAAVTGSAGKTTVKELLFAAVSVEKRAARNPGNFNNQLGLPLSMLACAGDEDVWVMELGISRPGDMEELSAIARPDLAVITNATTAHAEGLGGLSGVARAKASLLSALTPKGQGLVCRDYPELWEAAQAALPRVRAFSTQDESCEFFCRALGQTEAGEGRYELKLPGFLAEIELPLAGTHLAESVAAAAGAAWLLGVSGLGIVRGLTVGLAQTAALARRFCPRRMGQTLLIDDTYNANPLSMVRACQAARDLAKDGPLILVLGDMRELGEQAASAHEDLGRAVAPLAPLAVLHHGEFAASMQAGLASGGYQGHFARVNRPEEFLATFRGLAPAKSTVLFKGSRGLTMERFLDALCAELERDA